MKIEVQNRIWKRKRNANIKKNLKKGSNNGTNFTLITTFPKLNESNKWKMSENNSKVELGKSQ